ncbi:AraC family transcriptional regulator [Chelativorans sp. Marseille-P2723]|uniref:helix-turn-helix domain-containing protein n=1 Tax=Chelativorans sp. Marseille-P2723 TaxID=2709133 RepID=UPI00157125E7|nr:AraC family transcriptional regulator [Chelativorans sp. Marseille-P2723]
MHEKRRPGFTSDQMPSGGERRRWPRPQNIDTTPAPAEPALDPLIFSTEHLPRQEQFFAWQAQMTPLVDVILPQGARPEDGFAAGQIVWNLGSILFVQQQTPAYSYARSAARLRSSPIDHWYIKLPRTGCSWTEVNGQAVENRSGSVELRSLSSLFSGRTTASRSLVIYMPRDLFTAEAAILDANNNTILPANMAELMISYIDGIEAGLPRLSAEELPQVVQTIREMVLACLPKTGNASTKAQKPASALMERARIYVQQNLALPVLTPEALSRELGISRTRLYELFEPSGGVLHYIRRRRLLAAHAALSDPADARLIGEIAEAVGFPSAASFSRAFHDEFGYPPREARNVVGMPVPDTSGSERTFENWLKALSA